MSRRMYTFLLFLLLPFTPLKLLWRARKQPEYLAHWRERYGFYSLESTKPVIWLHCVSVGETRAAEPLIKALLHQYPNHQILLTHTTPTGRDTSERLFGNTVTRVYLPYDLPFAVKSFLHHFKPVVGVLMETELWFNLIAACKQQALPLLLVNARLSEKSALGYAKLGQLVKQGLHQLSAIAAQNTQDAQRLMNLGASNVSVVGNLKFDVVPPEEAVTQGKLLRDKLGQQRPVFLAASTRDGEEILIIEAIAKANIPNLLTMIVPRHPQRFTEVAELLTKQHIRFAQRSTLTEEIISKNITYVLGDSMGEMFTYYAACDVAFIGGSLLPLGGQNLIEACSMGKPVLIGSHTFNFELVTELAIDAGAAKRVQNSDELAQSIKALFEDQTKRQAMGYAAQSFSAESRGATQRTMRLIEPYIKTSVKRHL